MDDRLTAHQISVYLALFQQWNKNRFPDTIFICRNEIMQASKVGSTKTYYKCLQGLHEYGYIVYTPSYCPISGSKVSVNVLSEASEEDENGEETPSRLPSSTPVKHEQIRPSSRGKSDIGKNFQVSALLKHKLNLLNIKTREARARKKKEVKFTAVEKKKKEEVPAGLTHLKKIVHDVALPSSPAVSLSGRSLVSRIKKEVPRDFLVPTLQQVRDFFVDGLTGNYADSVLNPQNRAVEAEKFFYHYEANGWTLGGKVPMRNWKASCRSWVAKIPYFSRKVSKSAYVVPERKTLHIERFDNYAEVL